MAEAELPKVATQRDMSLDPFHAIGKLLYGKRVEEGSEEVTRLTHTVLLSLERQCQASAHPVRISAMLWTPASSCWLLCLGFIGQLCVPGSCLAVDYRGAAAPALGQAGRGCCGDGQHSGRTAGAGGRAVCAHDTSKCAPSLLRETASLICLV